LTDASLTSAGHQHIANGITNCRALASLNLTGNDFGNEQIAFQSLTGILSP